MGKKTKLQGFFQGASQVVDFIKGSQITYKEYDSKFKNARSQYDKVSDYIEDLEDELDKLREKKQAELDKLREEKKALEDKMHVLNNRLETSKEYVAFKNYAKQLKDLYNNPEKKLNHRDIEQLSANNLAVRNLRLFHHRASKYGQRGTEAISRFNDLMLDNDLKKLKFARKLPVEINLKDLSNMSLPRNEEPDNDTYGKLQRKVNQLSKRLEELDANRHVNSLEFRRMKAALNVLKKDCEKKGRDIDVDDRYAIGEHLEALQAASVDYVKAKGVGRQSTTFGKDRMDFALDLVEMSSDFMDSYVSRERVDALDKFAKDHGFKMNGYTVERYLAVDYEGYGQANIFEDKERGITATGEKEAELDDDDDDVIVNENWKVNGNKQNMNDSELGDDDEDELDDDEL